MNKKERALLFLVVLIGGWLSGMVCGRSVTGQPALAQQKPPEKVEKTMTTAELRIVDAEARMVARLGVTDGAPALSLHDRAGNVRALLRLLPTGEPTLTMHDKDGKPIWRTIPYTAK